MSSKILRGGSFFHGFGIKKIGRQVGLTLRLDVTDCYLLIFALLAGLSPKVLYESVSP
jgi:hypothetical protein